VSPTLSGKVALVTGAAQGAGRGVADALADEGASVAIVGRTLEKLEIVADEIEARGGRACALRCDVGVEDDILGVIDAVVREFDTVDILVNAAHHTTRGGWLLQVTNATSSCCGARDPSQRCGSCARVIRISATAGAS
jgi:meso-butanediol dehydrogenase / (S,S)-butanediol dehydrogenase / diacetyl reductase